MRVKRIVAVVHTLYCAWALARGTTIRWGYSVQWKWALGRGNWTFFGSDTGGKTAAVLRSFIASCKRCGVDPFAWFHDVLSRVPGHSIARLSELMPHHWKPLASPAQV